MPGHPHHATTPLTIGSTFAGYGGLDRAVEQVFPTRVAWVSEYDKAPTKILAHNYPDVPNHDDITTIDWATIEPVDILTGGYPCQPFSAAGARKGTDDKRHLFPFFAQGIETLRPRMVLAENVRGHLTLGFNVVLKEWVRLGYDVQWMLIKASDVGAPHGRARLFMFATDPGQLPPLPPVGHPVTELVDGEWVSPEEDLFGREPFVGKWPKAGRLVGPVVYDNTDVLGDPVAAIREHLGSPTNPVRFDENLNALSGTVTDDLISSGGELLPSPTAALGGGGQKSRSGARKDELLLGGIAEAITSGALLPTPRATRGGSGTETMYLLGAERSDDDRPQGQVLLPTPVSSLGNGGHVSVDRSKERLAVRGVRLDEAVNILAAAPRREVVTALVDDGASPARPVLLPTPTAHDAKPTSPSQAARRSPGLDAVGQLLPTPRASDGEKGGPNQRGSSGDMMLPSAVHHMTAGANALKIDAVDEIKLLPTPLTAEQSRARHLAGNAGVRERVSDLRLVTEDFVEQLLPTPTADQSGSTPESHLARKPGREVVTVLEIITDYNLLPTGGRPNGDPVEAIPGYEQWGPYAPAIVRWERITGRPAPAATRSEERRVGKECPV